MDGDGYFTDRSLSANYGQELDCKAGLTSVHIANKDCNISILGKYAITTFNSVGKIPFPLDELKYSTNLSGMMTYDSACHGDIAFMKNLSKLDYLDMHNDWMLYGDIANLANHQNLTVLNMYSTAVSGNVESLNGCSVLREIYLNDTGVGGNLNNLDNLPALQILILRNTRILEGNVESMAKFTKLTELSVTNNNVTGYVKTLCENMYKNGRTSGTLKVGLGENNMRFDDSEGSKSTGTVIATFSTSGVTYEFY